MPAQLIDSVIICTSFCIIHYSSSMFEIKKRTHFIRKTDTLHTVLGGEMLAGGNVYDLGASATEIVIFE